MASLKQAFNSLLGDDPEVMDFNESEVPESGSYINRKDSHTYLRDIPKQKMSQLKKYQSYTLFPPKENET